ncbi:MAG: phosphoribosylformylglycinamidine synthase II, phosphoribosylglycinamide formyltransferase 1 [Deltaproteobacteria bacterium CSP1-8]|nr:MAG: phosphoribosylformylglycinamidine synthase II, phosphoribosylglycinamide formyltransferase 1 [Deltaproteobacteria bacterium CSP1-8]
MSEQPAIAVLISGSGSNLQAILNASERGEIPCRVGIVISNKADAYGLVRAEKHGVPTEVVDHRGFPNREEFDAKLVEIIRGNGAELVCLAGFMRVLTPVFVRAFPNRILNIHPALLPSFPGTHGPGQALSYGVRFSGCTVHFLDEGVDTGPIIVQAVVPVYDEDTVETLAARILVQEHRIYPMAIRLFFSGKLKIEGRRVRVSGEPRIPEFFHRNPDA